MHELTELFTAHEGIAGHASGAATEGSMSDHIAEGIEAAGTGTGIATLHVLTSLVGTTIRIGYTLRTTLGRTAHIILQTGTDWSLLNHTTL